MLELHLFCAFLGVDGRSCEAALCCESSQCKEMTMRADYWLHSGLLVDLALVGRLFCSLWAKRCKLCSTLWNFGWYG